MNLLPNPSPFERAQTDTSERILNVDADVIRRERRADQCDAKFLPLLAWETSIHHWTGTDEVADRAAVASSFDDHCAYGSPEALEREISLDVGYAVKVRDFWEFGGVWPQFLVEIPAQPEATYAMPADVWASALRRKNVRDIPVVQVVTRSTGPLNFAAQMIIHAAIRILPMDPTPHFDTPMGVGAALRVFAIFNVRPFK